MTARGRAAAPRGVFSFEQPTFFVPSAIVLDTSFVVESIISTQPHHRAAVGFLQRLHEAGTVLHYNRLLEIELWEVAFRLGLQERHGRRWQRLRHDGRARRHASTLLNRVERSWADLLGAFRSVRVELHEVASEVQQLMSKYGLTSYDAVHAATSSLAGVSDFVTLDAGFAAVPPALLTLYVNQTRVRRCSDMRR